MNQQRLKRSHLNTACPRTSRPGGFRHLLQVDGPGSHRAGTPRGPGRSAVVPGTCAPSSAGLPPLGDALASGSHASALLAGFGQRAEDACEDEQNADSAAVSFRSLLWCRPCWLRLRPAREPARSCGRVVHALGAGAVPHARPEPANEATSPHASSKDNASWDGAKQSTNSPSPIPDESGKRQQTRQLNDLYTPEVTSSVGQAPRMTASTICSSCRTW